MAGGTLNLGLNTGYWAGGPPPTVDAGDPAAEEALRALRLAE